MLDLENLCFFPWFFECSQLANSERSTTLNGKTETVHVTEMLLQLFVVEFFVLVCLDGVICETILAGPPQFQVSFRRVNLDQGETLGPRGPQWKPAEKPQ